MLAVHFYLFVHLAHEIYGGPVGAVEFIAVHSMRTASDRIDVPGVFYSKIMCEIMRFCPNWNLIN